MFILRLTVASTFRATSFRLSSFAAMLRPLFRRPVRRLTASLVLVSYVAGCTHTPTGQKAFDSFEQCIGANLGLAAAGGVAIGALGKALARQLTGDTSTQNRIAVTAGVAASVMIGLSAWKKCAAVYNKSEPVLQSAAAPAPPPAVQRRPGVRFERLEVRVEGSENDPPVPEFDFTFTAEDSAAKDIKAIFRHKVEIVRFKADENDKLILADAAGEALRDASGRPIPLENAIRMPRERLSWVTIAEEGRDDYIEDAVIQQDRRSSYQHKLQVPPRAQLPMPLPVPMRYTVTVEIDRFKSARTVDFALLTTGERPKRYSAHPASTGERGAAAPTPALIAPAAPPKAEEARPAAPPAPQGSAPTHTVRRGVPLYDQASVPRKSVGRVARGAGVRVEERADIQTNNRAVQWAKVVTEDGQTGWLPASEIAESK